MWVPHRYTGPTVGFLNFLVRICQVPAKRVIGGTMGLYFCFLEDRNRRRNFGKKEYRNQSEKSYPSQE